MKDLAIFRRMVMFCLLLGSVYIVFDTVVSSLRSKSEKDETGDEDIEALNKMLEKFDVLTSGPEEEYINEPGSDVRAKSLVKTVEEKQRIEQDRKDRTLAYEELMKSVKGQEANRLLESAAKPLIELEDIRVEPNLHIPEDLPDIASELVGTPPDDAN